MTTSYFEKYHDKNKQVLNVGDVVRGEDGQLWQIDSFMYPADYPVYAHKLGKSSTTSRRELKPSWLVKVEQPPNYEKWMEAVVANLSNIFNHYSNYSTVEKFNLAKEYVRLVEKQMSEVK